MDLFEIQNGKVIPSKFALAVEPYKSMWLKDESEDKAEVINIFTYVECLLSPKRDNPFYGYPQEVKPRIIKERIWGSPTYQSDLFSAFEIIRLVDAYKTDLENSSPSYGTLTDAITTAQNTREYLRDVDLSATTINGALILKPKDVTGALKEIPAIIFSLEDARDRVIAELKEAAKTKGNREIGHFER